ncbi:ABC transporter ATP-binding protein [Neptunicella marina]|uniref:ABC transporter ATP-binding protein n=1 Tax=Neptunicella marina TaxID=2125989 RepID=A0A8J6ISG4_9ALTE|nr:ABC transporter ATP-binding protein [Neptunicella marina]MBC3764955.1 ABC transporter ATP-binding protein [Neptunicella marina]
MIYLDKITKIYTSNNTRHVLFQDLSFEIPKGHNIAFLGANGAGKSTLFRLIAGSEYPTRGKIITDQHISWPVALATGIHSAMTGRENTRFIGRINGVKDLHAYERKVVDFAKLGKQYDVPVGKYSSGMRSRLAFACSLSIDFDIYLIDEVTAVGDASFKKRAQQALLERSREANVIMISHQIKELKQFCDSAIVINKGQLTFYNDINEGIKRYQAL